MILCSLAYAQTSVTDILQNDSVCTSVKAYKQDNLMINDLLNRVAECREVDSLSTAIIAAADAEIQARKKIQYTLETSLSEVGQELEKKKRWQKISIVIISAFIVENYILLKM